MLHDDEKEGDLLDQGLAEELEDEDEDEDDTDEEVLEGDKDWGL